MPSIQPVLIQQDHNLERLFADHPATIGVFVARGMACPGCAMAPFETIADAAREYGLPTDALLRDVRRAVASAAPGAATGEAERGPGRGV
jgi:hybrid cluster-associated redox disulfide protein